MKLNRIAFFATLFSILCLGATFKSWADDELETYGAPATHDYIQHRTYIGVFGTSADIDNLNDFNGNQAYAEGPVTSVSGSVTTISNEEFDYIPTINRNFGFGGMVGHREGPWAAEVSYWYSNHTATIYSAINPGVPAFVTTATYTTINLDLKRYFLTTIPTQPFIDLGMNFAFLSSHNTSELWDPNIADPNTGLPPVYIGSDDQTDSGLGLNLGAGLEIYIGNGFSLVGGVVQRFTTFSGISGAGKIDGTFFPMNDPTNPTGAIEGNGLNFYVGTTVGIDQ
jgi:hypothetical protein